MGCLTCLGVHISCRCCSTLVINYSGDASKAAIMQELRQQLIAQYSYDEDWLVSREAQRAGRLQGYCHAQGFEECQAPPS